MKPPPRVAFSAATRAASCKDTIRRCAREIAAAMLRTVGNIALASERVKSFIRTEVRG
jgi:hypothetical protein